MVDNIDDIDEESIIIDAAFEKEIGIDINNAVATLVEVGISPEDMAEITNVTRNVLAKEIERKNISYEYRFLLLNVILCTMFKISAAYHKRYMKDMMNIQSKLSTKEKEDNITFVKEK